MSATLGGLIKDYRLQKNISQHEVAFALGWKEPSRLSRIEQGKIEKPPRELIEKIIETLSLRDEEKNTLLLAGNYLPTKEEIEQIRQEMSQTVMEWPYPSTILDFSWRVILENKVNSYLFQETPATTKYIYDNKLRVFDIIFNPDLIPLKTLPPKEQDRLEIFFTEVVLQFRYEQRNRTKEPWFIQHIKTLMKNDLFRKIWVKTNDIHNFEGMLGKFTSKTFPVPENPQKSLRFYLFVTPLLKDPRFEMERLVPADIETYKYFHKN